MWGYKFPDSVKWTGMQNDGGKEFQGAQSQVRKTEGRHKMKNTKQS